MDPLGGLGIRSTRPEPHNPILAAFPMQAEVVTWGAPGCEATAPGWLGWLIVGFGLKFNVNVFQFRSLGFLCEGSESRV